jgi:hypothetical protein
MVRERNLQDVDGVGGDQVYKWLHNVEMDGEKSDHGEQVDNVQHVDGKGSDQADIDGDTSDQVVEQGSGEVMQEREQAWVDEISPEQSRVG